MLETAPMFNRRRAGIAPATLSALTAPRPIVVRWSAHALFWGVYLIARTAAANAEGVKPMDHAWAEFPFLLNRTLVVLSYAAITGAILFGVSFLKGERSKLLANVAIVFGAFAVTPLGQYFEELWPSVLRGLPPEPAPLITYLFDAGWVLPFWGASQALIGYHVEVVEQSEAAARAKSLAYDAQLKALHYQINPHFLFNTLNAISTLILENRSAQAESMLMQLSAFLRYSLDRNPNDLAALSEELDVQRKYLEIEQTRFGEKLVVHFDVAPDVMRARVPSLILQPILENAIKHAVTPRETGGRIDVSARRDGDLVRLTIMDDGPGVGTFNENSRRGLGLANTRERLALLYGERGGLSVANRTQQSGCVVEIWLPHGE